MPLRTGIIGLGYRGRYLLHLLSLMPREYRVLAIAEPEPPEDLDLSSYRLYASDTRDYQRMLQEEALDLVVVASPWALHLEHATAAVQAGCHVALEIKGGLALEEYSHLSLILDMKGLRLFPLENTLFKREVMSLWQMCRAGVLGELVYLRGGYRHDLRSELLGEHSLLPAKRTCKWRLLYYLDGRQVDIYPTHGFAPLALFTGLGSADSIQSLHREYSRSLGLRSVADPAMSALLERKTLLGDIINTHIRTTRGILITLTHDTTLPRPRGFDWEVQGTKGIWNGDTRRIYIEGRSPHETWEDDAAYIDEYEHPYWQCWGREARIKDKHHEGMDFVMLRCLAASLSGEAVYPVGIADLALWTSITALPGRACQR